MSEPTDPLYCPKQTASMHYYQQIVPSKFRIFCDTSSIRGMQKISKAPTVFLRSLWTIFVLFMTIGLCVSSGFLIIDYLEYLTSWQETTLLDHATEFPAITLCSHNPFSVVANDLWEKKAMLTPNEFQSRLVNISSKSIDNSGFILYDNAEIYYVNIEYNDTIRLGHDKDMIYYCMLTTTKYNTVLENCQMEKMDSLTLRRFSVPKYFNCWTIQKKPNMTTVDVESLIMLIKLTPSEDISLSQNFIFDTLTQGEGLRLVVHDADSYPDVSKNGINVQPGKMNAIIYDPVKWVRQNTPIQPCRNDQKPIKDLDLTFKYSFEHCVDSALQNNIIKQCHCMVENFPRPHMPSRLYPYCLNVSDERAAQLPNQIRCFTKLFENLPILKKQIQNKICIPECNYFTYKTDLSITTWKPTNYKMRRITQLYNAVNGLMTDNLTAIKEAQKRFTETVHNKNKVDDETHSNFNSYNFDEKRYTYVSLRRRNAHATLQKEILKLDIYILVSRIGGLCSLCIGLTTAFFIELVEFMYLSLHIEKHRNIGDGGSGREGGGGCSNRKYSNYPPAPSQILPPCQSNTSSALAMTSPTTTVDGILTLKGKHGPDDAVASVGTENVDIDANCGTRLRCLQADVSVLSSPNLCPPQTPVVAAPLAVLLPNLSGGCFHANTVNNSPSDPTSPWHRLGNNVGNSVEKCQEEPVSSV